MYLTDRQSLLRAMYRLLDTDAQDGALTEFDETDGEGLSLHLQQGAEDAQSYMLGAGSSWWNQTSEALDFDELDDGRRRVELPDDFRRLFALPKRSALHDGTGQRWGVEIDPELKWEGPSNAYYIEGSYLWLVRRAAPPPNLVMDYIRRVPAIADGKDVDFPAEDRTLIVAFAALHAREEHWYTGGQAGDMKLERNLQVKRRQAFRRARRTSGPKRLATPVVQDHWALTG